MKPSIKNLLLSSALLLATASSTFAVEITFESPYTTGALSATPNTATNRPFTGQQGWSLSTSTSGGNIISGTPSGLALTGSTTTTSETYIGAKDVGAVNSYQFDFRYYTAEVGVGGWNDADTDSLFDHTEAQFLPGVVAVNSAGNVAFGVRAAGFVTSGGTYSGRFSTGTTGTNGNWYRMTVMPDSSTNQVSLSVYDLTSNSAVALSTSLINFTAAQFGVATSAYEGMSARVTSSSSAPSAIDNIKSSLDLSGSIFEWNLDNPETDTGVGATNGGSYHKVTNNDGITGKGAKFNLKLATGDAYSEAFWDTNKSWSNIFTGGGTFNLQSLFSSFGGTGVATDGTVTGEGKFAFTSNTLTWTAVPEPTSALAGLLITAGQLPRRRA